MSRPKYQYEIDNSIRKMNSGYVFTAFDFYEIADTDSINKALSRLCEKGSIRRNWLYCMY